jgi:adenosylcobinamide-GDP ribazoletransferase
MQSTNGMLENIKPWCTDIVAATRFLTRIPIGRTKQLHTNLSTAVRTFPFIGAVVGLIGGLVFGFASFIGMPPFLSALMALGATILVTGALHEDGLADTADGIGGGSTPAARLTIMRDSQIGVFGGLALILSVMARIGALTALSDPWLVAAALIAAGSLSRGILPWIMSRVDLASETGVAAAVGKPSTRTAAIAAVFGGVLSVLCLGLTQGIIVLVLAVMAAWVGARLAQRFLGGYNGDLLGAVQQSVEIVVLLAAVALV